MPRASDAGPARTAWVDAGAGVAGDMLLGALLDAGARLDAVRAAVEAVLPGTVRLATSRVSRAGLRANRVEVALVDGPPQPLREWSALRALLRSAGLPERVRRDALAVFARLADAEARVHGISAELVHFHEVGAWDSVADVVGCCAALADLGIGRLVTGPIAVGSGTVDTEHGSLPVPAPAVVELLRGWSAVGGGDGELATPTGVALLTALADGQGRLPAMRVDAAGTGAGARDTRGQPNVVRVLVGIEEPAGDAALEALRVLETNVDDLDPRVWPSVLAALLDAGAADAWLTPIQMKKGRPAVTLAVLARPDRVDALLVLIVEHTTSLGVRVTPVERFAVDRDVVTVAVDGPIRVKVGHRDGRVLTATPEYDDCEAVARESGEPVRVVLARAAAAADRDGISPGAPWPPRR